MPWSNLLRTSCLQGHGDSIKKLRQAIVKVLQDKNLPPNVGDDIPAKWVDIRKSLAKMQKQGQPTLTYPIFERLCMEIYGLADKFSVKTLAGYFFRIGVFTHYEDNLTLEDTIFLDNEWLTKGVYRIIDSEIVKDNEGKFTTKDLKRLYKSTAYEGLEAKFAELMHEFKICYRVAKNEYLCPLRLPVDEPKSLNWNEWQHAENLHYAIEYPFMPRGILSTFIVNIHKYITGASWRHGVILEHNEARALVYEHLEKNHIHIYIQGEEKRDFLSIIISKLQEIHKELNNLPHETKISCYCEECAKNPSEAYLFKAGRILRRWKKNIPHVLCGNSDKEISTAQLVGLIPYTQRYEFDTSKPNGRDMTVNNYIHNEYKQNYGVQSNIKGSTVGGNVTMKDNQVDNSQA